jgi:hypothetical protein
MTPKRLGAALAAVVAAALAFGAAPPSGRSGPGQAAPPEPGLKEIWERVRPTLPALEYRIEKDATGPSDTDPRMLLRRLEVKFYSQEIGGKKWGHPCVIFIPVGSPGLEDPNKRGRVVIVGQRSWDGLATGPWRDAFLGNYGDPIAALTGTPTMICPVPGEYDGSGGREIPIGFLSDLSKKTGDPADHNYFRLAIPYLRALDVMAGILKVPANEIRAVVGGHSKRATSAYTAAAADPDRIVGVVYMGNESTFDALGETPWKAVSPAVSRRDVKARVLYIGGTNEDGYRMFNINRIQDIMKGAWAIEIVPNYRHASMSEKHFLDWRMWIAHIFDGRPVTRIEPLGHRLVEGGFIWGGLPVEAGTLFRTRIVSPNKIIQVKVWYVYCDDEPYWRDLVWYPEFMIEAGDGVYEGYVKGKLPDAWLVEVKDTARGFPGYLSSLPQDITGKQTATRESRGSRSRLWEPVKKDR